ncbi:MAG: hypothetical protein WCX88_01150 [Patescibacteria group bacterium]
MKKLLIILGFLVAVGAIGFLMYYFFIGNPIIPTTTPEEQETGKLPTIGEGGEPNVAKPGDQLPENENVPTTEINQKGSIDLTAIAETANGGITKVSQLSVLEAKNVSLSSNGSLRYYSPENQKFYRVSSDGVVTPLSGELFYGVENITWASNQDKAILEYPDGTNIFYDFTSKKQYTVPENWHDFSFENQGNQIVFMNDDVNPDNRWLAVSNPDSTEVNLINQLGENGDKVVSSWSPNGQIIAFSQTGEPKGGWLQEIYAIGKNDENFPSLIVNGQGFEPKWSPDGKNLLYSVYNSDSNFNPTLWIASGQGDNMGTSNVNLKINTWAKKCAFSSNETDLYCAVPSSLEKGSGMFPELADTVADTIYKINLKTGQKSIIAYPDNMATIDELFISSNNNELYYKNIKTGLLEKIKIK